ncbi:MAG: hypothetical protein ACHQX3_02805 [Nitrospirales bacterium]|jgi:hypothetical protein
MSDAVLTALIVVIPPTIIAITGLILVLRKVEVVHKTINSRLDQWLEIERDQGVAEGRKQATQEAADKAPGA